MEDRLTKRIGERIQICREKKGMKQVELKDRLGISQNHISNLEQGKRRPSFDLLLEICEEFQVTPNFFLMDSAENLSHEKLQVFYQWASSLDEKELERITVICDNLKEIMETKKSGVD